MTNLSENSGSADEFSHLGGEVFILRGGTQDKIYKALETLREAVPENGPLTGLVPDVRRSGQGDLCLAIAAEDAQKLRSKIDLVFKAKEKGDLWRKAPPTFKIKGIHLGQGSERRPIGFLFPGQGSQYVDMLKDLSEKFQIVADTFQEADETLAEHLTGRLTDLLFTKGGETPERLAEMQDAIRQTEVTQPAMLTADIALARLLKLFGIEPGAACGHSLGEYGALVAGDVLSSRDALLTVGVRARSMTGVDSDDNGKMASISAPLDTIESVLGEVDGYVEAVNKNCPAMTVIAGSSAGVEEAVRLFKERKIKAVPLEVSHAFHSRLVAQATKPFGEFVAKLDVRPPRIPVLSNVTADRYPEDADGIRKLMVSQIESPVEFIREIERMYADGIRVFVEVGPKKALSTFAASTLAEKGDVVITSSNHPKRGGIQELNDLLARLAAAGFEPDLSATDPSSQKCAFTPRFRAWVSRPSDRGRSGQGSRQGDAESADSAGPGCPAPDTPNAASTAASSDPSLADEAANDLLSRWDLYLGPVVFTGVAAGVPGSGKRVFRDDAMDCVIAGENLIEKLPPEGLRMQLEKNLGGVAEENAEAIASGRFDSIESVIRLAGVSGEFDIGREFGVRGSLSSLMDVTAKLALAAGIVALKDAGIPLARRYRVKGKRRIPTSWALPDPVGAETGVILASAWPGLDSLIEDVSRFFTAKYAGRSEAEVRDVYERMLELVQNEDDRQALSEWYEARRKEAPEAGGPAETYSFSRGFLMRVLSLGHAQAAQFLRARGPNTVVNAACASTTQAVAVAEDWIRLGRAKRVLVIGADDPTSPALMPWLGTGFLSQGAASVKGEVKEAALPFDRRRNGMVMGMGACAMVIEEGREAARRGMRPRAELLAAQFENSAFHLTSLDSRHIGEVMDRLVSKAERRHGLSRSEMAEKMLYMSHETFTPASGGGCSGGEVAALKRTFGEDLSKIVIANTKGFTGHSMGASMEDVIAIHAMNAGKVPPIANYEEPDPELEGVTLSRGGEYDCEYALRLGAGFGSQAAMTLLRRTWRAGEPRIADEDLRARWLRDISGSDAPELEVVNNTLRIKEPPKKAPAEEKPPPSSAPAKRLKAEGPWIREVRRDEGLPAWTVSPEERAFPSASPDLSGEGVSLILTPEPDAARPFTDAVEKAGGTSVVLKPSDWPAEEDAGRALKGALKGRKVRGILDLSCLVLPDFSKATPAGFDRAYRRSVRALRMSTRLLREDLLAARGAWVAIATRMGAAFACSTDAHPLAGAAVGLARALSRELEGVAVRAVDFDAAAGPEETAEALLAELGGTEAFVETGRGAGGGRRPRFERVSLPAEPDRKMTQRSVVLVAGAARGIGAAIARTVARRHKCPIILVGGPPLPKEAASWARMSEGELAELKRRLVEDNPETADREYARVLECVDLERNIEELCRAGSKVTYRSAELSDGPAVSKAVKKALRSHGAVDYVFYAAGAAGAGFDADVRETAHGAFHLLRAVPSTRSQSWAFFSPMSARFGAAEPAVSATAGFLGALAAHLRAGGLKAAAFYLDPDAPMEKAVEAVLTRIKRAIPAELTVAAEPGALTEDGPAPKDAGAEKRDEEATALA